MESRKKRLGPSKFGVRYENQRASWQSERLVVSYLSWHSGLSWNSGVLMKTSERLSFSIAHLSPLKQLRCKSGQKLPWLVDEKPPKRTNSPARSLVVPIKHGLRRILSSRDDHVSFLLDPDWFWEDPLCDTSKWQKSSFSYVFFLRDIYLNLFFLINRYFPFLRYSYVLSIWKLTCLVCCLRELFTAAVFVHDWQGILSEVLLSFQLDKSSLSPK